MTSDLLTVIGVPTLGLLVLCAGLLSRRNLDLLVGDQGGDDVVDRRRATLHRGSVAITVTGAFLLVAGVAVAIGNAV